MIRLPQRVLNLDPQRAGDELAEAWEHLVAAAEHGAGQLEQATRRRAALARQRAAAVRRAARGEPPTSRWRWLGTGLAAGVVIGAVAAAVATRRPPTADQPEPGDSPLGQVRERASATAHHAASAARNAADAARDTVARVRDKIGGDADPEAPQPPGRVP